MAIYYFTIIVFALLSFGAKTKKQQYFSLCVSFIFLWLLASLRSLTIGNDTYSYYLLFRQIERGLDYILLQGRFEIGYVYLTYLVSKITSDFTVFLLLTGAYVYYAYFLFIKRYSANYMLSVLLFLCLGYWGQTVNVTRIQLAVATMIYAYILLAKENKRIGYGVGLFSILFHRLSIVYICSLIIPQKISLKFYAISLIVVSLCYIFFESAINQVVSLIPYYGQYVQATSRYSIGQASIAIYIRGAMSLLIWAFAIYQFNRMREVINTSKKKDIATQINMIFVSLLIFCLATKFNILDRCEIFYGIFCIVLIPNLVSLIKDKSVSRLLWGSAVVIAVAYFTVINVYRPEWNQIYPYHTFLFD